MGDNSDSMSALNNSMMSFAASGAPTPVNNSKPSTTQLVVSKPFPADNMSIIDPNNDIIGAGIGGGFGNFDLGMTRNNYGGVSSANNLLGNYSSLPAPIMGGGSTNFNFLPGSSTSISSTLIGTSKDGED